MKKIFAIVLAIICISTTSISAFAAGGINDSEREVINLLASFEHTQTKKALFPAQYVQMAENFFLSYDMTSVQKDKVLVHLNNAYVIFLRYSNQILAETQTFDIKKMPMEEKRALLTEAQAAGDIVGLTVTYTNNDTLKAVDQRDGTVWLDNDPIIKITGEFTNTEAAAYTAICILLSLSAIVLFASKKKLVLENN